MKELKISFMEKNGKLPRGIYAFKEPNIYYPVVYFRKSRHASKEKFEAIIKYLKEK
jgi:hypothetical protein